MKDILNYYVASTGEHIIGFRYGRIDGEDQGWSIYLKGGNPWEWGQKRTTTEFHPVGHRCILQWQ